LNGVLLALDPAYPPGGKKDGGQKSGKWRGKQHEPDVTCDQRRVDGESLHCPIVASAV